MAQIRPFDQPVDIRPNSTGADAFKRAGVIEGELYDRAATDYRQGAAALEQGGAALGKGLGDVYAAHEDNVGRQEISQGYLKAAEMQDQHTTAWNKLANSTDPNQLGAVAHDFETNVLGSDDTRSQFMSGFTTKKSQDWAQQHLADYQAHMIRNIRVDVAGAQSDAMVANIGSTRDHLANSVMNDPSQIPETIQSWSKTMDTMAEGSAVPKEHWQQIKAKGVESIVQAGIYGAIKKNPDAGIGMIQSGQYDSYLQPKTREELLTAAQTGKREAVTDQLNGMRIHEAQQRETDRAGAESVYGGMTSNADGTVNYPQDFGNQVLHSPDLSPATKRAMLNGYHRQMVAPVHDDPGLVGQFAQRLGPNAQNPLTPDEVTSAVGAGQMSERSAGFFYRLLSPKTDPTEKGLIAATTAQAKQTLNDPANPTPEGAAGVAAFQSWFLPAYQTGKARGLTPQQMLSPDSPDYLLKERPIDSFKVAPGSQHVEAIQQQALPTHSQLAASNAVDVALRVTGLSRSNSPEQVNDLLKENGINLDVRDNAWCAALVNSALHEAGLPESGSNLASSFKTWGHAVDTQHVRKGDVFYSAAEGYTGHVGLLTGATRQGANGPQVQVVSSHLQGSGDNGPAGVEWRDARGMLIRRAQPPLNEIFGPPKAPAKGAAPASSGSLLGNFVGGVKDFFSTDDAAPKEEPEEPEEQP